jgi:hypothetical protein
MEEEKASEPAAPAAGQITPEPSEVKSWNFWKKSLNRKRYWFLFLLVILTAAGGLVSSTTAGLNFLKNITDLLVNRKVRASIVDLREQYRKTRNILATYGSASFAGELRDVNDILKLDPGNGTGLYYSGEIQRLTSPQSLFDEKSCIKPEKLREYHGTLDAYQNAFKRYVDVEKAIEDKVPKDFSAEACYPPKNTPGYCVQRTAWIDHLLANDMYEEAVLMNDGPERVDKLARALAYETNVFKYQDENEQPGFSQCTPTSALMAKIHAAQAGKDAPATTH